MFSIKEENAISCILSTVRVATLIVFSEKDQSNRPCSQEFISKVARDD